MQNKVGILGGTFNPIHNGHIMLAISAYEQFNLDKVLVMISPNPPHKAGDNILSLRQRLDMVKLAICDYPDILEFSDFELHREGYIYSSDTLTLLTEQNPDTEYYFIIGGDSLKNIENWHKPEIVLAKAAILAAVRDDMDECSIKKQIEYLNKKYICHISPLKFSGISVSSSIIRDNVKNNINISNMVPKKVFDYIIKNNIYKE